MIKDADISLVNTVHRKISLPLNEHNEVSDQSGAEVLPNVASTVLKLSQSRVIQFSFSIQGAFLAVNLVSIKRKSVKKKASKVLILNSILATSA